MFITDISIRFLLCFLVLSQKRHLSAVKITVLQEGADDNHCCVEVLAAPSSVVKDVHIFLSPQIISSYVCKTLTLSSLSPMLNGFKVFEILNDMYSFCLL